MGHMTQPLATNSVKAPKKIRVLSGPPHHAYSNTTTMQYETKTHKIHTDKHK